MDSNDYMEDFLKDLQESLKKEMPRIRKEIKVYERKLLTKRLTKNPIPAPQFYE